MPHIFVDHTFKCKGKRFTPYSRTFSESKKVHALGVHGRCVVYNGKLVSRFTPGVARQLFFKNIHDRNLYNRTADKLSKNMRYVEHIATLYNKFLDDKDTP